MNHKARIKLLSYFDFHICFPFVLSHCAQVPQTILPAAAVARKGVQHELAGKIHGDMPQVWPVCWAGPVQGHPGADMHLRVSCCFPHAPQVAEQGPVAQALHVPPAGHALVVVGGVVVEAVVGDAVDGAAVVGDVVDGGAVVGDAVDGAAVVGDAVDGAAVVGDAVEGAAVD